MTKDEYVFWNQPSGETMSYSLWLDLGTDKKSDKKDGIKLDANTVKYLNKKSNIMKKKGTKKKPC